MTENQTAITEFDVTDQGKHALSAPIKTIYLLNTNKLQRCILTTMKQQYTDQIHSSVKVLRMPTVFFSGKYLIFKERSSLPTRKNEMMIMTTRTMMTTMMMMMVVVKTVNSYVLAAVGSGSRKQVTLFYSNYTVTILWDTSVMKPQSCIVCSVEFSEWSINKGINENLRD